MIWEGRCPSAARAVPGVSLGPAQLSQAAAQGRTGARRGRLPGWLLWAAVRYCEQQPSFIPPMLLSSGDVPGGDGWTLEVKWDGCRAQLRYDGRSVSVRTRNGRECSADFPELAGIAGGLGKHRVTL